MSAVPVKINQSVYINGEIVPGIVSVKAEENKEESCAYEFLSSEAWAVISSYEKYTITLKFYGKKPLLLQDDFLLSIETDGITSVYQNCIIKSKSEYYSRGKLTTEIKIISGKKE